MNAPCANGASAAEQINAYIDGHRGELTELLCNLIAVKSLSFAEADIAALVADTMRAFGYDEVTRDAHGSVIGRVGSGKTLVLYDAHVDTVAPGSADEWGFAPLSPRVEDGLVKGRGAVDDKGSLAAMLFAGKAIKALGLSGDFTLLVSASVAEEVLTGVCVREMVAAMPQKPDVVVVGEPSECRLVRGHKGRAMVSIPVAGKAAHASAAHMGENAIAKALPAVRALDALNGALPTDPVLGKGTLAVTMFRTDSPSLNTVPGSAEIIYDRRTTAGETAEDLLAEAAPAAALAGAKLRLFEKSGTTYTGVPLREKDYCPSWHLPEEHPSVQAGVCAYRALFGAAPVIGTWTFCTNATYLAGEMGIPCIGFGPGDGKLCHTTREALPVEELATAAKFFSAFPFFAVDGAPG